MTTVYRVTMKDGKAFSMLDPSNQPPKEAAAGIVARFGRERIETIKRQPTRRADGRDPG